MAHTVRYIGSIWSPIVYVCINMKQDGLLSGALVLMKWFSKAPCVLSIQLMVRVRRVLLFNIDDVSFA